MSTSQGGSTSATVVVFLFALFLFVSPFTGWWARLGPPWYVPYLLWLGVIVATWLSVRNAGSHDL